MLTLYTFGPAWGLPDPSPFVVKTMVHLKMAGVDYREDRSGFPRAPKGKLPFIEDGDKLVADSTFIREHIEQTYGVDLDRNPTGAQRALSWAIERMLEDHLYWAQIHLRWADDENFDKGPAHFFDAAPAEIRDDLRRKTRQEVLANLRGHGLGRHSDAEIAALASRSLRALSEHLGDKPYLMGESPRAVDATALGFVGSILTPYFSSQIRDAAASLLNLVAYRDRMMERYFPGFEA
jgi:glutathione S-transferase